MENMESMGTMVITETMANTVHMDSMEAMATTVIVTTAMLMTQVSRNKDTILFERENIRVWQL